MTELKILAVDDEPSVLNAISRLLRADGIQVLTATSGAEALRVLEEETSRSIGVLVSDYAMPAMNGAELLYTARLRWPDITRVLLTGNADLPAASRAVNEGQLSLLYTKPWKPDDFRLAMIEALEQHRVGIANRQTRALAEEQAVRLEQLTQRLEEVVAEQSAELERANTRLQHGLLETVNLFLTSLEQRLPKRAAQCKEVARLAGRLAARTDMRPEEARWVQVAALVHDVGLTGLADALLLRPPAEQSLMAREQYQHHAVLGQRMLGAVAELTEMATWIRHHHERWDGRGYPDRLAGDQIPLPSRIIAVADGYLHAAAFEAGTAARWRAGQITAGEYDPYLLQVLDDELADGSLGEDVGAIRVIEVPVVELRSEMAIFDEVYATTGSMLLRAGETRQ